MREQIELMADYYCFPLWRTGSDPTNLDPDELPLRPETRQRLLAWAERYDATLNHDYPPDSGFASPQEEAVFEREGIQLWLQLRAELPDHYEVVYYSGNLLRLFTHPDQLIENRR